MMDESEHSSTRCSKKSPFESHSKHRSCSYFHSIHTHRNRTHSVCEELNLSFTFKSKETHTEAFYLLQLHKLCVACRVFLCHFGRQKHTNILRRKHSSFLCESIKRSAALVLWAQQYRPAWGALSSLGC